MPKPRKICLVVAIFFIFFSLNNVYAITKKQAIIKNCDRIRETLKGVQRSDSYTRIYLDSVYDEVLNKFIKPVNNRLNNNEDSDEYLKQNQDDFVSQRQDFKTDFIDYSKTLEDLIIIDCKIKPDEFYEHLKTVRIKREIVNDDIKGMEQLIEKQKSHIKTMKEEYENWK